LDACILPGLTPAECERMAGRMGAIFQVIIDA
jgi:hypothetical protein